MKIDKNELHFSQLSNIDQVGRVFFYFNKVYRGIYKEALPHFEALFQSGLLQELQAKNLVPATQISDLEVEGFALIVRHEGIFPISYPYEWSFEMLKSAALVVLEINQIAQKYGYQTKDCHYYNLLFDGTIPKFVDIGSFEKRDKNAFLWAAHEEFLQSYAYLLQLAASQSYFLTKRLLGLQNFMPHEVYLIYRYPFLRTIGIESLKKICRRFFKFRKLSSVPPEKIKDKLPSFFEKILLFLVKNSLLPYQKTNFEKLKKQVLALKSPQNATQWGNYHDQFHQKNQSTPRFERLVEILKKYSDIKQVFEIAGNQGFFATLLLEKLNLDKMICSDYDENAVDSMFRLNPKNTRLTPVLLDFVTPTIMFKNQVPQQRFLSDLVIALAVTHHLVLTQQVSLHTIFEQLGGYTKKYILVEFMPLGLYDGTKNVQVPTWYTLDWFKTIFESHFDLILTEDLEVNRIVFFGKHKA